MLNPNDNWWNETPAVSTDGNPDAVDPLNNVSDPYGAGPSRASDPYGANPSRASDPYGVGPDALNSPEWWNEEPAATAEPAAVEEAKPDLESSPSQVRPTAEIASSPVEGEPKGGEGSPVSAADYWGVPIPKQGDKPEALAPKRFAEYLDANPDLDLNSFNDKDLTPEHRQIVASRMEKISGWDGIVDQLKRMLPSEENKGLRALGIIGGSMAAVAVGAFLLPEAALAGLAGVATTLVLSSLGAWGGKEAADLFSNVDEDHAKYIGARTRLTADKYTTEELGAGLREKDKQLVNTVENTADIQRLRQTDFPAFIARFGVDQTEFLAEFFALTPRVTAIARIFRNPKTAQSLLAGASALVKDKAFASIKTMDQGIAYLLKETVKGTQLRVPLTQVGRVADAMVDASKGRVTREAALEFLKTYKPDGRIANGIRELFIAAPLHAAIASQTIAKQTIEEDMRAYEGTPSAGYAKAFLRYNTEIMSEYFGGVLFDPALKAGGKLLMGKTLAGKLGAPRGVMSKALKALQGIAEKIRLDSGPSEYWEESSKALIDAMFGLNDDGFTPRETKVLEAITSFVPHTPEQMRMLAAFSILPLGPAVIHHAAGGVTESELARGQEALSVAYSLVDGAEGIAGGRVVTTSEETVRAASAWYDLIMSSQENDARTKIGQRLADLFKQGEKGKYDRNSPAYIHEMLRERSGAEGIPTIDALRALVQEKEAEGGREAGMQAVADLVIKPLTRTAVDKRGLGEAIFVATAEEQAEFNRLRDEGVLEMTPAGLQVNSTDRELTGREQELIARHAIVSKEQRDEAVAQAQKTLSEFKLSSNLPEKTLAAKLIQHLTRGDNVLNRNLAPAVKTMAEATIRQLKQLVKVRAKTGTARVSSVKIHFAPRMRVTQGVAGIETDMERNISLPGTNFVDSQGVAHIYISSDAEIPDVREEIIEVQMKELGIDAEGTSLRILQNFRKSLTDSLAALDLALQGENLNAAKLAVRVRAALRLLNDVLGRADQSYKGEKPATNEELFEVVSSIANIALMGSKTVELSMGSDYFNPDKSPMNDILMRALLGVYQNPQVAPKISTAIAELVSSVVDPAQLDKDTRNTFNELMDNRRTVSSGAQQQSAAEEVLPATTSEAPPSEKVNPKKKAKAKERSQRNQKPKAEKPKAEKPKAEKPKATQADEILPNTHSTPPPPEGTESKPVTTEENKPAPAARDAFDLPDNIDLNADPFAPKPPKGSTNSSRKVGGRGRAEADLRDIGVLRAAFKAKRLALWHLAQIRESLDLTKFAKEVVDFANGSLEGDRNLANKLVTLGGIPEAQLDPLSLAAAAQAYLNILGVDPKSGWREIKSALLYSLAARMDAAEAALESDGSAAMVKAAMLETQHVTLSETGEVLRGKETDVDPDSESNQDNDKEDEDVTASESEFRSLVEFNHAITALGLQSDFDRARLWSYLHKNEDAIEAAVFDDAYEAFLNTAQDDAFAEELRRAILGAEKPVPRAVFKHIVLTMNSTYFFEAVDGNIQYIPGKANPQKNGAIEGESVTPAGFTPVAPKAETAITKEYRRRFAALTSTPKLLLETVRAYVEAYNSVTLAGFRVMEIFNLPKSEFTYENYAPVYEFMSALLGINARALFRVDSEVKQANEKSPYLPVLRMFSMDLMRAFSLSVPSQPGSVQQENADGTMEQLDEKVGEKDFALVVSGNKSEVGAKQMGRRINVNMIRQTTSAETGEETWDWVTETRFTRKTQKSPTGGTMQVEVPVSIAPNLEKTVRRVLAKFSNESRTGANVQKEGQDENAVSSVASIVKSLAGDVPPISFTKFSGGQQFNGITSSHLTETVEKENWVISRLRSIARTESGVVTANFGNSKVAADVADISLPDLLLLLQHEYNSVEEGKEYRAWLGPFGDKKDIYFIKRVKRSLEDARAEYKKLYDPLSGHKKIDRFFPAPRSFTDAYEANFSLTMLETTLALHTKGFLDDYADSKDMVKRRGTDVANGLVMLRADYKNLTVSEMYPEGREDIHTVILNDPKLKTMLEGILHRIKNDPNAPMPELHDIADGFALGTDAFLDLLEAAYGPGITKTGPESETPKLNIVKSVVVGKRATLKQSIGRLSSVTKHEDNGLFHMLYRLLEAHEKQIGQPILDADGKDTGRVVEPIDLFVFASAVKKKEMKARASSEIVASEDGQSLVFNFPDGKIPENFAFRSIEKHDMATFRWQLNAQKPNAPRYTNVPRQVVSVNAQNIGTRDAFFDAMLAHIDEVEELVKSPDFKLKDLISLEGNPLLSVFDKTGNIDVLGMPHIEQQLAKAVNKLLQFKARSAQAVEWPIASAPGELREYVGRVEIHPGIWKDTEDLSEATEMAFAHAEMNIKGVRYNRSVGSFPTPRLATTMIEKKIRQQWQTYLDMFEHPEDIKSKEDALDPKNRVRTWELFKKGKNWYIPGETVLIVRVPADNMYSTTVVRAARSVKTGDADVVGAGAFPNVIRTPLSVQIAAGSDFDVDKRFIIPFSKSTEKTKGPDGKTVRTVSFDSMESGWNSVLASSIGDFSQVKNFALFTEPLNTGLLDTVMGLEGGGVRQRGLEKLAELKAWGDQLSVVGSALRDQLEKTFGVEELRMGEVSGASSLYESNRVGRAGLGIAASLLYGLNIFDSIGTYLNTEAADMAGNTLTFQNPFAPAGEDAATTLRFDRSSGGAAPHYAATTKRIFGTILNLFADHGKLQKITSLGITHENVHVAMALMFAAGEFADMAEALDYLENHVVPFLFTPGALLMQRLLATSKRVASTDSETAGLFSDEGRQAEWEKRMKAQKLDQDAVEMAPVLIMARSLQTLNRLLRSQYKDVSAIGEYMRLAEDLSIFQEKQQVGGWVATDNPDTFERTFSPSFRTFNFTRDVAFQTSVRTSGLWKYLSSTLFEVPRSKQDPRPVRLNTKANREAAYDATTRLIMLLTATPYLSEKAGISGEKGLTSALESKVLTAMREALQNPEYAKNPFIQLLEISFERPIMIDAPGGANDLISRRVTFASELKARTQPVLGIVGIRRGAPMSDAEIAAAQAGFNELPADLQAALALYAIRHFGENQRGYRGGFMSLISTEFRMALAEATNDRLQTVLQSDLSEAERDWAAKYVALKLASFEGVKGSKQDAEAALMALPFLPQMELTVEAPKAVTPEAPKKAAVNIPPKAVEKVEKPEGEVPEFSKTVMLRGTARVPVRISVKDGAPKEGSIASASFEYYGHPILIHKSSSGGWQATDKATGKVVSGSADHRTIELAITATKGRLAPVGRERYEKIISENLLPAEPGAEGTAPISSNSARLTYDSAVSDSLKTHGITGASAMDMLDRWRPVFKQLSTIRGAAEKRAFIDRQPWPLHEYYAPNRVLGFPTSLGVTLRNKAYWLAGLADPHVAQLKAEHESAARKSKEFRDPISNTTPRSIGQAIAWIAKEKSDATGIPLREAHRQLDDLKFWMESAETDQTLGDKAREDAIIKLASAYYGEYPALKRYVYKLFRDAPGREERYLQNLVEGIDSDYPGRDPSDLPYRERMLEDLPERAAKEVSALLDNVPAPNTQKSTPRVTQSARLVEAQESVLAGLSVRNGDNGAHALLLKANRSGKAINFMAAVGAQKLRRYVHATMANRATTGSKKRDLGDRVLDALTILIEANKPENFWDLSEKEIIAFARERNLRMIRKADVQKLTEAEKIANQWKPGKPNYKILDTAEPIADILEEFQRVHKGSRSFIKAAKMNMDTIELLRKTSNTLLGQKTPGKEWILKRPNYVLHMFAHNNLPQEQIDIINREESGRVEHRVYATYEAAALDRGLVAATLNAAELIEMWTTTTNQIMVNKMLLGGMAKLVDINGNPMIIPARIRATAEAGQGSVIDEKDARQLAIYLYRAATAYSAARGETFDWIEDPLDSVWDSLDSLVRKLQSVDQVNGNSMLDRIGYRRVEVSKAYGLQNQEFYVVKGAPYQAILHLTQPSFTERANDEGDLRYKFLSSIIKLNRLVKSVNVGFSLFHHFALMESWLADTGASPAAMWRAAKNVFNARKTYNQMMEDPETVVKWVMAGLQFQATPYDIDLSITDKPFAWLGEKFDNMGMSFLGNRVRGVGNMKRRFDDFLWHQMVPVMKIQMAEAALADVKRSGRFEGLAKGEAVTVEEKKAENEMMDDIAKYVNDALGSQEWTQYLWATPAVRDALNTMIFAPDWTLSALSISGAPEAIGNAMGKNWLGYRSFTDFAEWRRFNRYIPGFFAWVFLGWPTIMQVAISAAFGGGDDDKMFPWENESGRKGAADITPMIRKIAKDRGAEPPTRRTYIQPGKQMREIAGWFKNPVGTLFGKSSVVVRVPVTLTTSVIVPSLRSDEVWSAKDDREKWAIIMGSVLPFAYTALSKQEYIGGPLGFALSTAMPRVSGVSGYEVAKRLKSEYSDFLYSRDVQKNLAPWVAVDTLNERVEKIHQDFLRNGATPEDWLRVQDSGLSQARSIANKVFRTETVKPDAEKDWVKLHRALVSLNMAHANSTELKSALRQSLQSVDKTELKRTNPEAAERARQGAKRLSTPAYRKARQEVLDLGAYQYRIRPKKN